MVIVAADELVPCPALVHHHLLPIASVLQFPAPVREPIADLNVSQSRGVRQLFLLLSVRVRILPAFHQPLLETPLNVGREELLRVSVATETECTPTPTRWGPRSSAAGVEKTISLETVIHQKDQQTNLFIRLFRMGRIDETPFWSIPFSRAHTMTAEGHAEQIYTGGKLENMKTTEHEIEV